MVSICLLKQLATSEWKSGERLNISPEMVITVSMTVYDRPQNWWLKSGLWRKVVLISLVKMNDWNLACGYSSETTQRELFNEYQHDRIWWFTKIFASLCIGRVDVQVLSFTHWYPKHTQGPTRIKISWHKSNFWEEMQKMSYFYFLNDQLWWHRYVCCRMEELLWNILLKLCQGSTLRVNLWPQASKNFQKQLRASKKRPQLVLQGQ